MNEGEDLVGREADLRRIRSFIGSIGRERNVLVLTGDPGLGKTVLLEASWEIAQSAGARPLPIVTNEYEAGVSFAALNQGVAPLTKHLNQLARSHRSALSVALGLRNGSPAAPLVLAAGVLALFDCAAADRPLLLTVDDVHWIDPASAGVLALVARRLRGAPVGLLASVRSGWESNFDPAGLPLLEIAPLDDAAAAQLLARLRRIQVCNDVTDVA
jgi:hypothetical protein